MDGHEQSLHLSIFVVVEGMMPTETALQVMNTRGSKVAAHSSRGHETV